MAEPVSPRQTSGTWMAVVLAVVVVALAGGVVTWLSSVFGAQVVLRVILAVLAVTSVIFAFLWKRWFQKAFAWGAAAVCLAGLIVNVFQTSWNAAALIVGVAAVIVLLVRGVISFRRSRKPKAKK